MQTECNAVFLFVAELTGSFISGSGNVDTKIGCGQQDYINNVFLELDLDCEEDRKSLHENIWLERLYKELDQYFMLPVGSDDERLTAVMSGRYREDSYKWTVPIELDASALTYCYQTLAHYKPIEFGEPCKMAIPSQA